MIDYKRLMQSANAMRERAHVPYSHYRVGAVLVGKSGKEYTGCNLENAAFSPTICAERTAFAKAISEGEKEFSCIAIVGGREGEISPFCAPCGVCRQVMTEFCDENFELVLGTPDNFKVYKFSDVMPFTFTSNEL